MSHSKALVVAHIGPVEVTKRDIKIQKAIEKSKVLDKSDVVQNIINKLLLNPVATPFSRTVYEAANKVLDNYHPDAEVDFEDCTDEVNDEYNTSYFENAIQWSNGTIEECHYSFGIIDGIVVELNKGKNGTPMRSHKAKKISFIGRVPIKDAYKSAAKFAYDEYGYIVNKETGKIGYWYNPNTIFTDLAFGGRYPAEFFINAETDEYMFYDKEISNTVVDVNGKKYRAVIGCRKKDFDLDVSTKMMQAQIDHFSYDYIIDDNGTFIQDASVEDFVNYINTLDDNAVLVCIDLHI